MQILLFVSDSTWEIVLAYTYTTLTTITEPLPNAGTPYDRNENSMAGEHFTVEEHGTT